MAAHVDAKPHADPAVIRKILTAQVTAPVQWEQATSEMLENGYETGYELGPGAVVAGILKRVKKDAEIDRCRRIWPQFRKSGPGFKGSW